MSDMGLSIAASGLIADTAELDTASNNLSNINTPGYAAEQVNLSPQAAAGPLGSGQGVLVNSVSRLNDAVFFAANLAALGANGAAKQSNQIMQSIETIFPEPSSNGIQSKLSALWSDLSTLASNPSQTGAQQAVVSAAQSVATAISGSYTQLSQLSSSLQAQVGTGVNDGGQLAQVNGLLSQVAKLNSGIAAGSAGGENINSLQDQSAAAVTKLGSLIGVTSTTASNGTTNLYLNGIQLVSGDVAQTLITTGSAATKNLSVSTSNGAPVDVKGEIGATLTAINTKIPTYVSYLNSVSDSLGTNLNNLQANGMDSNGDPGSAIAPSGYSGTILPNIFVDNGSSTSFMTSSSSVNSSATIAVSPQLLANTSLIATASAPSSSNSNAIGTPTNDGSNAQAMAALASSSNGPDAKYQSMIGALGTDAANASQVATSAANLATVASQNMQSISGVDVNTEEMKILSYQNNFQAATRVVSAINNSMQSLLQAV